MFKRAPARQSAEIDRLRSEDRPQVRELVSRSWPIEETVFSPLRGGRASQHEQNRLEDARLDEEISPEIEITSEMVAAGVDSLKSFALPDGDEMEWREAVISVFMAMLSARPLKT